MSTKSTPASGGNPAQLRREIEQTRADLGRTVQELAAKADVRTRAKESATAWRSRARDRAAHTAHQARERSSGAHGPPAAAARTCREHPARVAAGAGGLAVVVLAVRQARHGHCLRRR